MAINQVRDSQCNDNVGGNNNVVYVFPYVKFSRSSINVVDNILTAFPFTTVYNLDSLNVNFNENIDEEEGGVTYSQVGSFDLNKIKSTDDFKYLVSQDYRAIVQDNNGNYRLVGLETGLKFKFSKEIGVNLQDFNGFKFSFETKEENTAPFINNFSAFFETPNPNILEFFKIQVLTTTASETFTIPIDPEFIYGYSLITSDAQAFFGNTGNTTITFPVAGSYEIEIRGTFPKIIFNDTGDKNKITAVNQWGNYSIGNTNQKGAFQGCNNLTTIANDVQYINLITEGNEMFFDCNLSVLPIDLTLPFLQVGTSMLRKNNFTDLPSGMTLPNLQSAVSMFAGVTINTTRYSQLLVDFELNNNNNNVPFHGGNSKYNGTGETARNTLTATPRLWPITDGGLE